MILVTGATGNVGRELTLVLVKAGHQVRALTRGSNQSMRPPGVDGVTGDLNQPETLSAALDGCKGYSC
jgi:uncharacterized protein YbjT (DUF2867 family)